MKDVNITVENGVKEVVIRQGSAPDIEPPLSVEYAGDIDTPANYYQTRKHIIDHDKAIVVFDRKGQKIELDCDPSSARSVVMIGKLEKSDELGVFGINSQKTYTQQELVKLIRMNRRFFKNRAEADGLLTSLSNFKFNAHVESQNNLADNRGNKSSLFNKKVDTENLPNSIILSLPLFKNTPAVDIVVELVLDVAENTARFWLESVDLDILIQEAIDAEFEKAKAVFVDTGIAIVTC